MFQDLIKEGLQHFGGNVDAVVMRHDVDAMASDTFNEWFAPIANWIKSSIPTQLLNRLIIPMIRK